MGASASQRIFLYGTLRRGGSRDALAHYDGAEFVAPARVRGVLHDFVDYPGLLLDPAADWVRGELFDVTPGALAGLDEWEGIDPREPATCGYRRVRVQAHRDDGAMETCWVYEIAADRCAGRPVIASGDWLARGRER
ncbi:MAG: gamma-glutamylcyclotransferase [Terrimicrobiaceae bacterium]|nr:gamma-glutamylcyclotransferase [Terrimicrobiaceae bacterium]